jgi:transposase-like protein
VRLMFQDEARFGRMVRIRRRWAQKPERPTACNGYEREFVYVYGAVSPIQGQLDWMLAPKMNTATMRQFLAQVSAAHRREFNVMVIDGASSHVAKDLMAPKNIRLIRLPPYAPELNPQEHVWDELREKEFPNRVYNDLNGVRRQLQEGLPRLAANRKALRSLTAWPWINSLNLNAHWNQCMVDRPQLLRNPAQLIFTARLVVPESRHSSRINSSPN